MITYTDFQEAINRILPERAEKGRVYRPGITTSDGIRQDFLAPRPAGRRHKAVDMNYHHDSGAPVGQNEINLTHPEVYSPVSGLIVEVKKEKGKVIIEDTRGFKHELLHLDEIKVEENSYVAAGQVLGTMGGRGPAGAKQFQQHVHYLSRARITVF